MPSADRDGHVTVTVTVGPDTPESPATHPSTAPNSPPHHHHHHPHHAAAAAPHVPVDLLSATDEAVDTDMLAKTVAEAGRWAFGIMAADVWVLSDDQTRLYQPSGGFWIDPVYRLTQSSEALERLCDESRDDYCRPTLLSPGEGLGGVLWFDTMPGGNVNPVTNAFNAMNAMMGNASRRGGVNLMNRQRSMGDNADFSGAAGFGRAVVWRDVKGLANDPDQPYNEKVRLLAAAGFGLAAGVPFNVRGHRGIVVYLARSTADPHKLQRELNTDYLRSATDVIGAVSAMRRPRQACIEARRKEARSALARAKKKILFLIQSRKIGRLGEAIGSMPHRPPGQAQAQAQDDKFDMEQTLEDLNKVDEEKEKEKERGCLGWARKEAVKGATMWARKLRGGGVAPPPVMPVSESAFAFVGAFVTMISVLYLNRYILRMTDDEYFIVLGPIASLQTVVYGLVAAPASQPRNMILGNIVSIPVSIVLRYIHFPPAIWRTALSTAISTFTVTALGITHPPATSMAAVFALSTRPLKQDWALFGFVLVGNVVVIGMATVINNVNQKRQFPTYWGHLATFLHDSFRPKDEMKSEEEEEEERKKES